MRKNLFISLWVLLTAPMAWAGSMTVAPSPISVPPNGTVSVTYQFQVSVAGSVDLTYGIHTQNGPNGPADFQLSGSWDPTGTIFTFGNSLASSTPIGAYTYRAQNVGNTDEAIGTLIVNPAAPPPSINSGGLVPASVPLNSGDTSLVIYGSNFQAGIGANGTAPDAPVVNFGSTQLSPLYAGPGCGGSCSQINVTVPGSLLQTAQSVNVTVTNLDGQTSNAQVFTIGSVAPPVVTNQTPSNYAYGPTGDNIVVQSNASGPCQWSVDQVNWNSMTAIPPSTQYPAYSYYATVGSGPSPLPAGTYRQYVQCADPTGVSFSSPLTIVFTVTQIQPPVVTNQTPSNYAYGPTGDNIVVQSNASGPCQWSVDQVNWFGMTSVAPSAQYPAYSYYATVGGGSSPLPAGTYTQYAQCADPTGTSWSSPIVITFTVTQIQPPVVTNQTPSNYAYGPTGDNIVVQSSLNGPCQWSVDQANWFGMTSIAPSAQYPAYSYYATVGSGSSPLSAGTYTQYAQCADPTGTSWSSPIAITFAVTAALSISGSGTNAGNPQGYVNPPYTYPNVTYVNVFVTTNNSGANVTCYESLNSNMAGEAKAAAGANSTYYVTFGDGTTPMLPQRQTAYFQCTDGVTTTPIQSVSFTIIGNTTPPTITPDKAPGTYAGPVTITFTVADNAVPNDVVSSTITCTDGTATPACTVEPPQTGVSPITITVTLNSVSAQTSFTVTVIASDATSLPATFSDIYIVNQAVPPTPGLVSAYGALAQADLTILAPQPGTFTDNLCSIFSPNSCGQSQLTWTNITDNGSGNVADPSNGTMNNQGWRYADQFVQISNVQANGPGWYMQIYTDNLNNTPTYIGPSLASSSSVSGLVSTGGGPSVNGQFRIPLSWLLTTSPISLSEPTSDPPQQVPDGGTCVTAQGTTTRTAGFCDFATHFLGDKGDQNPATNPASKAWWEFMPAGQLKNETMNYQTILTSDGAATGDLYRSPYSTIQGIPPYYLYIGAQFAPGTIKALYQTTIFVELVSS